jgi:glycosyl-4,4'-diaponeurosporenoate acyltransferase
VTVPLLADLPTVVQVVIIGLGWFGWSVVCGYVAHRRPAAAFDPMRLPYRLMRWERDGRSYERIRIRRWKDRLPEAGEVFDGGFSKRHLASRDLEYLDRFAVETCRAEFAHWAMMALVPIWFVLFVPLVAILNVGYALGANLPCLLVQRFNRARLLRIRARLVSEV